MGTAAEASEAAAVGTGSVAAAPGFAAEAASLGFEFAFADGEPYWDERVRYVFTRGEVEDHLEKAAADLQSHSVR